LVAGENIHCVIIFLQSILRIPTKMRSIFLYLTAEFNSHKCELINCENHGGILFFMVRYAKENSKHKYN
jgi:hypothetical protein